MKGGCLKPVHVSGDLTVRLHNNGVLVPLVCGLREKIKRFSDARLSFQLGTQ